MDSDAFFWAGAAGSRAETIAKQKRIIREERERAQRLEQTVNDLKQKYERMNYIARDWITEAVEGRANGGVAVAAFKEATGQTVREYLGDAETDRRVAAERDAYRKEKGLK